MNIKTAISQPETSEGRLHNALLDAGIADWMRVRQTEDKAALEVEFLDHPTAEQIAALKAHYDVLTFDELVYTFVERTSVVEPSEAAAMWKPAVESDAHEVAAFLRQILQMPNRAMPSKGAEADAVFFPVREAAYDHGLVRITISGDYVVTSVGEDWLKQQPAAPLVDPEKAKAVLIGAWGQARAGRIQSVKPVVGDPRVFLVETRQPIPDNASLAKANLEQVDLIAPNKVQVRLGNALWLKLLAARTPAATDTTEAAVVADTDTQPIPGEPEFSGDLLFLFYIESADTGVSVKQTALEAIAAYDALAEAGMVTRIETPGWNDYAITQDGRFLAAAMMDAGLSIVDFLHEPDAEESGPDLDDRDLEIADLRRQVGELHNIVKALTPITDEWQTVKITLPKDGKIMSHPEIAAEQAKGWDVHHVNYISNGEDRLYVLMVKRGKAKHEATRHYAAGGYVTSGSPFMRRDTVVPVNGKGEWSIADVMIDQMNDELTPSMNALAAAFGVDLGAWR